MPDIDERELGARVDEMLNRNPSVGLAVGVVRNGGLDSFDGHGVADIASGRPVTPETVFRIASITKTMVAVAAMQLWEQGLIDLDAPVREYLRSYRLVPRRSGWRPVTVRQLMTHTSGIGEEVRPSVLWRRNFGETVPEGQPLPTLAEYYADRLPVVREPGTRFRYTNHGPATLGQVVEDVSGVPFAEYLRDNVFEPLGMVDSTLDPTKVNRSRFAQGYRLTSRGPQPVPVGEVIPQGGGGVYSTLADMARYVAALVGGGANDHGAVLKPGTLATMFEPQYRPDPRIPGIGLAFFRGKAGEHEYVEHQGTIPGFDSQLFAAHHDGTGVLAFSNGTRQGTFWLPTEMGRLLHDLLGAPQDEVPTDVPQRPEVWGELCGRYWIPGPLWEIQARGMMGLGLQVLVRHGRLWLRELSPVPVMFRGFELHSYDPDDPYVFKIDLAPVGIRGALRVVFSREPGCGVTAAHLDVMPLTAYKKRGRARR